jgi:hypothetical protein
MSIFYISVGVVIGIAVTVAVLVWIAMRGLRGMF